MTPLPTAPVRPPPATDAIFERPVRAGPGPAAHVVGVLPGEGIGAEVTEAALAVLRAVEARSGVRFAIEYGGVIGLPAVEATGRCLSDEVIGFCRSVFDRGGAILAGAGGGRFVYDFRRQFDLFIKLNPVVAWPEMDDVRIVKGEVARSVDMLVVRENLSGLYQGETRHLEAGDGSRTLEHRFLDIDYACYLMLQEARSLDVVAAPNCFADILSDLGGLLMGGRGLTFGASYGRGGEAVYQTNHGAAYDLQGTGKGNPLGQILSMGMMLRESFGLIEEAEAVDAAVRRVLGQGFRTGDIAAPGGLPAGTAEMADRIAAELRTV